MSRVNAHTKLSELALAELTGPPNGGVVRVEQQILAFEQRYEMSSAAMLRSGLDTADTAKWRVLLQARGRRRPSQDLVRQTGGTGGTSGTDGTP